MTGSEDTHEISAPGEGKVTKTHKQALSKPDEPRPRQCQRKSSPLFLAKTSDSESEEAEEVKEENKEEGNKAHSNSGMATSNMLFDSVACSRLFHK